GRALWGWPAPGEPLESGAPFPGQLAETTPIPEHFRLLRITLKEVELLELGDHPHQRRRWWLEPEGSWYLQNVNP
ncbi:MAG: pyridoxamine 5'-phosphate oxidase, partial [Prochlorococcaceae cyanobacterium]